MKKIKYLLFLFFIFSFANVKALTLDQTRYEAYGIQRAYIICDYAFDLSKVNPKLKDFLLAAQSCPTDRVTVYEIKVSKGIDGNLTRSYQELLSSSKLQSFPTLNLKYIYSSSIGGNEQKEVIDSSSSTVTHVLDKTEINQTKYESYNITRSYIIGAYIFDLSKHNPTLQDFMIANQSAAVGTAKVIEAKSAKDINGNLTRSYVDIITGQKITSFPTFQGRYIFGSTINPSNHNKETRTDLITGETINNGSSDPVPTTPTEQTDADDPRNKPINYQTQCMGRITIPGTNGVVNNICVRWKDKSKYSGAEANDVSKGIYTLPVSNYPNVKNGNLVLAAHSGNASISYFKTLYLLKLGDKAYIHFNGNQYEYIIKNIYLVPKTGVVKITRNSSRTTLTLITCTRNDEAHQTVYILELNSIDGKEYH